GLYLADHWDWSKTYPVLRIEFAGNVATPERLESRLQQILDGWESKFQVAPTRGPSGNRALDLIPQIAHKHGKVVVLIDEYDKPITDALPHTGEDFTEAYAVRDILRSFYGVFKSLDEHLKFLMLTGVTKWAKAGIFSGLNQLNDITLDPEFGAICGYT